MSDQHTPERTSDMSGHRKDSATRELATLNDTALLPVPYAPGPEEILAEPPDARDIASELAAPPRRKLPWLPLLLTAGMIAGLGFAGGAYFQKTNGTAAATGFPSGAQRPGGTGGAGGYGGFGGGAAGGAGTGTGGTGTTATTGTVKLVDGDTVYLTTGSGTVVKVTTKSSTKITTVKTGRTTDLLPGQSVTVQGSTDTSGNVTAATVTEGG